MNTILPLPIALGFPFDPHEDRSELHLAPCPDPLECLSHSLFGPPTRHLPWLLLLYLQPLSEP